MREKSKTITARELIISKGASRHSQKDPPKVGAVTWDQLAKKLTTFITTEETFAEYQAAGNAKLDMKDVGWFVGGPFDPPQRRKVNLQHRCVLTLDFDHLESCDIDLVWAAYEKYTYVAHTSHSHSSE